MKTEPAADQQNAAKEQSVSTATTAPITACLLHADYHRMDRECWGVVLDWQERHLSLPEQQRRNEYQAAVERAILNHARAGR